MSLVQVLKFCKLNDATTVGNTVTVCVAVDVQPFPLVATNVTV